METLHGDQINATFVIQVNAVCQQGSMVVMKLAAPDAGRRRALLRRCTAIACGLALAGCGGAAAKPARALRGYSWLEPMLSVSSARLTGKVDSNGAPLPGGSETFVPFMFPVAVVTSMGALFIADAGHGRLFRYQHAGGLMAIVPGVRINATTRLRAGPGGIVYVLDGTQGVIQRYSMMGQSLSPLQARYPASHYLDFDVDQSSGRVFAVDSLTRLLDQIEPLGRLAIAHLELNAAGPVALDGAKLLVADAQCQCVNEWRDRRLVRKLAFGQIRLPKALAADEGEVYVLDGFDRSISRVFEGGLESMLPGELGLISPEQISVFAGMMHVADGSGRSVSVFRIRRRQH